MKQNARFLPKVDKFTNLRQKGMSVQEYSLIFTMLSKYVSSLVSNHRDKMSHFMTGVADIVREEYRTTMLQDDVTLYRLMVYEQSI